MSTSTSLKISINGVDNASKTLEAVRGKVEDLNHTVVEAGAIGKQTTSVMSAGFSALNGTITGAIGGARGMAQAISAMGVAMNTAMPLAAAAAAALYAIKKAYDAIIAAQQARADLIKAETDAIVKQQSAVRGLEKEYDAIARQRNRMANIQADIAGYSPGQKKGLERDLLQAELADKRRAAYNARLYRDALARTVEEDRQTLAAGGMSSVERAALEEKIAKAGEQLKADTDHLRHLGDDIQYLEKQIELNAKQQRDMAEAAKRQAEEEVRKAEEKAAEERQKAAEAWLEFEEAVETARDSAVQQLTRLAERRDAEIRSAAQASLSRSVSQTTGGARATSLEDVARISALLASGIVQRSSAGYVTAQGDAMRQAERDRRTEQYQQKMLQLVEDVARNAKVSSTDLNLNVMDF